jgi:hypothetical protein
LSQNYYKDLDRMLYKERCYEVCTLLDQEAIVNQWLLARWLSLTRTPSLPAKKQGLR